MFFFFFFFSSRRRHTRFDCDWSSDVCSSDLEEFLEHGGVMHGLAQYEESVRVPLVLWGPELPAGLRVADGVSLVDLMPTVLDVLGLSAPAGLDGVSLRSLWESPGAPRAPRALFVEAYMDPPGP